jgi:acetylornithine deacetylase/succinyl-diaminopimelate desuccinylase-like protein
MNAAELLELTRALVAAPTPNPPGDERAILPVLERYLAGVDCRVHYAAPDRPTLVAGVGDGPRTLVLAAHTDTHPVGEGWTADPLGELRGDTLFGRGTTDNKGAVAAMAAVLRASAVPPGARLVLVANADEETGGRHGAESLCAAWGLAPDAVLVAEPSGIESSWEALWVAARGTLRWRLRTRGRPTHSSLAGQAPSAVESLDALLAAMRRRLPVLDHRDAATGAASRLTVVEVHGGAGWGVVPAEAGAACELRLVPGLTRDEVEDQVAAAFEAARKEVGADAELDYPDGGLRWMAPSASVPEEPIVRAARAAWREVRGEDPALGCFPGGTDARLFEAAGSPTVIAGPGALARAHHADEYVTADELVTAARLYAATVAAFFDPEESHAAAGSGAVDRA